VPFQVVTPRAHRDDQIVVDADLLPPRVPTARPLRQWIQGVSARAHLVEDARRDKRQSDDGQWSAHNAPEIAAIALTTERKPTIPDRNLRDGGTEIVALNVVLLVHRSRLDRDG
jgi:hypothetical protein